MKYAYAYSLILVCTALIGSIALGGERPPQGPPVREEKPVHKSPSPRARDYEVIPPQGPPVATLCPCSLIGICNCGYKTQCVARCIDTNQYRWQATNNPNQIALYRGAQQLGNWWIQEQEYRRLVTSGDDSYNWIKSLCPVDLPKTKTSMIAPAPIQTLQTLQTFSVQPQYQTFGIPFRGGGSCGPGG